MEQAGMNEDTGRGMDDDFHFVENEDINSCGTCSVVNGGEDDDEQILSSIKNETHNEQGTGSVVASQESVDESVLLLQRQVTDPEESLETVVVTDVVEDKEQAGDSNVAAKETVVTDVVEDKEQAGDSNVAAKETVLTDVVEDKEQAGDSNVAAKEIIVEDDTSTTVPDTKDVDVQQQKQHEQEKDDVIATSAAEASQIDDQAAQSSTVPSAPSSVSPSQFCVRDADYDEQDSQLDWDSVSQCVSNFVAATIPDNMLAVEQLIERMSELGQALHSADGHRSVIDEIISMGGEVEQNSANSTTSEVKPADNKPSSTLSDLERVYQALEQRHVVQALQSFMNTSVIGNVLVDFAKNRVKSISSIGVLSVPHLCDLLPVLAKLLSDAPELATLAPVLVRFVSEVSSLVDKCAKAKASDVQAEPVIAHQSKSDAVLVEHRHVLCDGCNDTSGKYITGVRWKSAIKEDFDLCSTCEATGNYEEEYGPFLKITSPKKAPREIMIVLRDNQPRREASRHSGLGRVPLHHHKRGDRIFPSRNFMGNSLRGRAPQGLRCSVSRPPAPAVPVSKKDVLKCPNEHTLLAFQASGGYTCDSCQCNVKFGSILRGCRICDFDMCNDCASKALSTVDTTSSKASGFAKVVPDTVEPAPPQHQQVERPRARFVADMSLPDGAIVSPNEKLVKTWRINNPGSQAWPTGVKLVCVGGDAMQGENGLPVPSLSAGAQHDIKLNFVAPKTPGRYVGYWRLMTSGSEQMRFGHRLWIDLNVQEKNPEINYHQELARLWDMGFQNQEQNLAALDGSNGDVEEAIAKLLAE